MHCGFQIQLVLNLSPSHLPNVLHETTTVLARGTCTVVMFDDYQWLSYEQSIEQQALTTGSYAVESAIDSVTYLLMIDMAGPVYTMFEGTKRLACKIYIEGKKLFVFIIIDEYQEIRESGTSGMTETLTKSVRRWYGVIGNDTADVNVGEWINEQVGFDWLTILAVTLTMMGLSILGVKYAGLH